MTFLDTIKLKEINLHGYPYAQGLDIFINNYNLQLSNKSTAPIKIIHGYGSTGDGGKIRSKLRFFLKDKNVRFETGENIDYNPGYTIVFPQKKLPETEDILGYEILKYLNTPKTKKKIAGHFRNYGDSMVISALKKLEKQDSVIVKYKGKHKCYFQQPLNNKK